MTQTVVTDDHLRDAVQALLQSEHRHVLTKILMEGNARPSQSAVTELPFALQEVLSKVDSQGNGSEARNRLVANPTLSLLVAADVEHAFRVATETLSGMTNLGSCQSLFVAKKPKNASKRNRGLTEFGLTAACCAA